MRRAVLAAGCLVACSSVTAVVPDGGDSFPVLPPALGMLLHDAGVDAAPDVADASVESAADVAQDVAPDVALDVSDASEDEGGPPPQVCCQLTQPLYGYIAWCACNNGLLMHGYTGAITYNTPDAGNGLCYSSVPSAYGNCDTNYACSVSIQGGGFGTGYCL